MCIASHSKIPKPIVPFLNFISILFKTLALAKMSLRSLGRMRFSQVYVISVDNLSFGGTGKTPLILALGKFLEKKSIRFAVITRGYKSKLEKAGAAVSTDHRVEEVGDEALILKKHFPGQGVFVGGDRVRSIRKAISFRAKIVILDDGFQSTHLFKDFRIMLVNPGHPYFYLRHFRFLMRRSDCLLFYRIGTETDKKIVSGTFDFEWGGFFNKQDQEIAVSDSSLFVFSAVGDNERFQRDMAAHRIRGFKSFADHHAYTRSDLDVLEGLRRRAGAEYLVCTEKDFVKIGEFASDAVPLIYVKNRIKLSVDLFERIWTDAREKKIV